MIRFLQPNDLATAPADRPLDIPQKIVDKTYFEAANLSWYVFELQDDAGIVRAILGAFQYVSFLLNPLTSKINFHVVATESSAPIPIGSFAIYAGLNKNAPIPGTLTG